MTVNPLFEITDVAGEYMAIPIGDAAKSFSGIVVLNEATALLLKQMKTTKTEKELVDWLVAEYEVDIDTAQQDIRELLTKLYELGVVLD